MFTSADIRLSLYRLQRILRSSNVYFVICRRCVAPWPSLFVSYILLGVVIYVALRSSSKRCNPLMIAPLTSKWPSSSCEVVLSLSLLVDSCAPRFVLSLNTTFCTQPERNRSAWTCGNNNYKPSIRREHYPSVVCLGCV